MQFLDLLCGWIYCHEFALILFLMNSTFLEDTEGHSQWKDGQCSSIYGRLLINSSFVDVLLEMSIKTKNHNSFDQVLQSMGVVWRRLIPGNGRRSLLHTYWDPATDNTPHHKAQRRTVRDRSAVLLMVFQGPTPKQLPLTTFWQQAELEEVKEVAQARIADSCATRPNSCRHCLLL